MQIVRILLMFAVLAGLIAANIHFLDGADWDFLARVWPVGMVVASILVCLIFVAAWPRKSSQH